MLEKAKVLSNELIASDVYRMELETSLASSAKAGQFIEIEVPNCFLRRPISIAAIEENKLVIIYKVLGKGTDIMKDIKGGELSILGPLGNGFPIVNEDVLLIGGGIGVPPLYELARQLLKNGARVTVVMGFLNADQVILKEEFETLGIKTYVTTDDGSYGFKGNVLDCIKHYEIPNQLVMACGPLPMLKALSKNYDKGYLSLEQRMACGIGACMGCVVKGSDGKAYRVCKDGPVFPIGKVEL